MSSYLQKQLKDKILSKNLTVYSLEKKAGLNRSAVRNIMQGLSKNPSVTTLSAIALALDCDLTDLIGPGGESLKKASNSQTTSKTPHSKVSRKPSLQKNYMWNETLYLEAVKTVADIIKNKKLALNLDQITNLINEIYKYSVDKHSHHIDKDFCAWLINKQF